MINDFNYTIDIWIETIQRCNFQQLCMQPDENNWSIGQVCIHHLNDTNWFIQQIETCLLNHDNANENMLSFVQNMFVNNSFPDEKLANLSNANMRQPASKEDLLLRFIKLKKDMNEAASKISVTAATGKTKHPGLQYFNAAMQTRL